MPFINQKSAFLHILKLFLLLNGFELLSYVDIFDNLMTHMANMTIKDTEDLTEVHNSVKFIQSIIIVFFL